MTSIGQYGQPGQYQYGHQYQYGQQYQYGPQYQVVAMTATKQKATSWEIAGGQVFAAQDDATMTPAPQATAPAGAPPDVTRALLSVPIAQDGIVITADFHNSLRAAIASIAGYLGEASLNAPLVTTLAPTFVPVPGAAKAFDVSLEKATGANNAVGWRPVELPDGARLQSLVVLATAESTVSLFEVTLERVPVEGGSVQVLAKTSRKSGDGTMKPDEASIAPAGVTSPAAIDEMRQVDNGGYRYAVRAAVSGTGTTTLVSIHSLQVAFTRW